MQVPIESITAWDVLPASLYSVFRHGTRVILFRVDAKGREYEVNLPAILVGRNRTEIRQHEKVLMQELEVIGPRRRMRTSLWEPRLD
jgi:hypothetical protein